MAQIWRQAISWSNVDKNLGWLESTGEVYELTHEPLQWAQAFVNIAKKNGLAPAQRHAISCRNADF